MGCLRNPIDTSGNDGDLHEIKIVLAETCSWHVMCNWQYSCVTTVMSMHNSFLIVCGYLARRSRNCKQRYYEATSSVSAWISLAPNGWIFTELESFAKICPEKTSFIKIWHEWPVLYMQTDTHLWPVLYMQTDTHLWQYLAHLFLQWYISDTSCTENQNTHFRFNIFRKLCRLSDSLMCKNVVQPDRPQKTT